MLIEFKGMMYDTEKWYVNYRNELVKVIRVTDDGYLKYQDINSIKTLAYGHLDTFDITKIALPEKKKIIPEEGKVYEVTFFDGDEVYYLKFDGKYFCQDGGLLNPEHVNVLAEMR